MRCIGRIAILLGILVLAGGCGQTETTTTRAGPEPSTERAPALYVSDTLGVDPGPTWLALAPQSRELYVGHLSYQSANGVVSIIDLDDRTLTDTLVLPAAAGPEGAMTEVATHSSEPIAYVVNDAASPELVVIDTETHETLETVPLGLDDGGAIAVDPSGDTLYLTDSATGSIVVLDSTTFEQVGSVDVGGFPVSITADPSRPQVYVPDPDRNTVSVIDTDTLKVLATVSTHDTPWWVAVDESTGTALVNHLNDASLLVFDTTRFDTRGDIPLPTPATAVAVDAQAGVIYAPLAGFDADGTVLVLDSSTGKELGTVTVGTLPVGVLVDPSTGLVFVANRDAGTVSVLTSDPAAATDQSAPSSDARAADPSAELMLLGEVDFSALDGFEPFVEEGQDATGAPTTFTAQLVDGRMRFAETGTDAMYVTEGLGLPPTPAIKVEATLGFVEPLESVPGTALGGVVVWAENGEGYALVCAADGSGLVLLLRSDHNSVLESHAAECGPVNTIALEVTGELVTGSDGLSIDLPGAEGILSMRGTVMGPFVDVGFMTAAGTPGVDAPALDVSSYTVWVGE